jgi:uncharacterized protein
MPIPVGAFSSFDRAGCQARNQILLRPHEHDQRGQDRERDEGQNQFPVRRVLALVGYYAERPSMPPMDLALGELNRREGKAMREALIVWGGWSGHEPERCAGIVAGMLEEEGFKIRVENSTGAFADPGLADMSLIVPIITMAKIEKKEVENLTSAVRGGVGLAGFHGGMCDAFREAVEYQFMCGGQWVAHPGNIIDYRVNILRRDDPVMQGIEDFDYRSEQYYMHVDPSNEVLATTTFSGEHAGWIDGVVMPVVWKRRHGEGRVFYSSLGHVAAEFDVPQMRTFLRRGMLWAAR